MPVTRVRLRTRFRRDGTVYEPGAEIDVDRATLDLLGGDCEIVGLTAVDGDAEERAGPSVDAEHVASTLHDVIMEGAHIISDALRACFGRSADDVDCGRPHNPPPTAESKGQGPERDSGWDDPGLPGGPGEDGPTAGAGSDDPPGAGALGGEAGAGDHPPERTRSPLRAAIHAMAAEDPGRAREGWWLKNGAPAIDELERRGIECTATERDTAWMFARDDDDFVDAPPDRAG